ncbi:DEAD/DEAH box helicase family protein [Calothrix sp. FACHB-1219]|uniref:DEAD/DEAH box helicase n=1 Tax=unclassified Calothrix TaxID=2619626 RepID=UPI001688527B|nr:MULTISPECIES: DEAD/DEAH box helicase family protein [unclassified Calothrix]MBD2201786.1 DEAD/DEAH box helicase family protein [Calothrix sp. FACHB-168]MBD2217472.1 DEAD/DEAH box helicase family protein [Calothrix sp. FACHB-1219]
MNKDYVSLCNYQNDKLLIVPTGLLVRVINLLKKKNIEYSLTNLIDKKVIDNGKELPSYLRINQIEAINKAIEKRRGVINLVTGYGKTVCIAELIRRLGDGVNCLVTVHRINILYQLRKEIATQLEMDEKEIGLIGNSKISIKGITIASRDSITSKINSGDIRVIDYLKEVRVWLLDEVHRMANSSGALISSYITNSEYRIGFTATDEVEAPCLLEGIVGPNIIRVLPSEAIEEKVIMEPDIRFYSVTNVINSPLAKRLAGYKFNSFGPKEMRIYNILYDEIICKCPNRNKLAAELIYEYSLLDRGPIIVFVKKVATSGGTIDHADIVNSYLSTYGISLPVLHGNTSIKQRLSLENALRDNTIPGVIATIPILSEGISIKSIGAMMFLQGGSAKRNKQTGKYESIEWIQGIGRALRIYEGKEKPIIFDFIDSVSIFNTQAEKRFKCANDNYPGYVRRV